MVQVRSVSDVLDDPSTDLGAVFEALGREPGEVEGGVDADGRKIRAAVHARREFIFGQDSEIRKDVFEPSVFSDQFAEPVSDRAVGVFLTAVDVVVLKVDAGFWLVAGEALEFSPCDGFVCLLGGVWLADGERVGASPGTGVFDVVVAGHVFCYDGDVVAMVSC